MANNRAGEPASRWPQKQLKLGRFWRRSRPLGAIALALSAALAPLALAPAAVAQWDNPQPDNRVAKIRFRNQNTRSVYALYISPRYADQWQDLLGDRILKSGAAIDLELNYDELFKAGCDYRIKAIYSDGSQAVLEDQRYDLCNLRQVQFGPFPSPGGSTFPDYSTPQPLPDIPPEWLR